MNYNYIVENSYKNTYIIEDQLYNRKNRSTVHKIEDLYIIEKNRVAM